MAIDVEATYRRYGPMVLRRCRRLLGDEQAALDAMQDTFVQLVRRADTLTDDAPSSLMYRIATNVCLNRIRARGRRPEVSDDDLVSRIAAYDGMESRSLARRVLARVFAREPVSTGTIAVLHHLEGLTLEEVAREVGLSVSGVRKRLRKLRRGLEERQGATP